MSYTATRPLFSHKFPPSSKNWLARQFRDPYVRERLASPARFRARSAFKLLELDEKWKFFQPDVQTIVDLGAAPGGWSQVAAAKLGWTEEDVVGLPRMSKAQAKARFRSDSPSFGLQHDTKRDGDSAWSSPGDDPLQDEENLWDMLDADVPASQRIGRGTIVAVDLLRMLPIPGVKTVQMDFLSPEADDYITSLVKSDANAAGKVDIVLSDMAANTSGNKTHDVESALDICHAVIQFARKHLNTAEVLGRRKAGVLILKYFEHPLMAKFRHEELKPYFNGIYNSKPAASRSDSSEGYWICMGFHSPSHSPRTDTPEVTR